LGSETLQDKLFKATFPAWENSKSEIKLSLERLKKLYAKCLDLEKWINENMEQIETEEKIVAEAESKLEVLNKTLAEIKQVDLHEEKKIKSGLEILVNGIIYKYTSALEEEVPDFDDDM